MSKRELWQDYLDKKNSRPLCGYLWEPDIKPLRAIVTRVGKGNLLKVQDLVEEDLLSYAEYVLESISGWESDFIQAISPCMGVPWIEAIVGCRLVVHEDTIWAEPPDSGYEWLKQLKFDPENKWVQKLIKLHQRLIDYSDNRFPVCLPVMHGPLDILSAFMSPAHFCLDMYDRPDEIKIAASSIARIWLEVAQRLMEITPPFLSGWFTRMNLYMREKCATPQADVTSLISDRMYREFGFNIDQGIISNIPGSTYHTHSTSAHVLQTIASIKNLKSLQVTMDPNGPSKEELKAVLENCQKRVPLLLAVWNVDDFLWALNTFNPRGLAVVLIRTEMKSGREEFNKMVEEVVFQ